MEETDVWSSAASLIERRGVDASVHACLAANAALADRDHPRKEFWIAVWHAIADRGTAH